MQKFVPTLTADKKYSMKLVAVINESNTVYTYIDDDGDQMLVRRLDDPLRIPYVNAILATRVNPKTSRSYTVVIEAIAGEKFEIPEIAIPDCYRKGIVLEGEPLYSAIRELAEDALNAVEYVESEWESDCEAYVDRKLGGRPSRACKDSWHKRAVDEMDEACKPFGTNDKKVLTKIISQL